MELVSIIIPTYRRSGKINEVVTMALAQSYEMKEVIVVDDNGLGTDQQIETQQNLQGLIESESITYIPLKENSGACKARNIGVAHAKGSLLAFFDDDDKYDDEKIKLHVKALDQNPHCGVSVCGLTILSERGNKEVMLHMPRENQFDFFLQNLNKNFGLPLSLIKKSDFVKCGGLDESFKSAQDLDLNLRILRITKACFINLSLIEVDIRGEDRISSNIANKIDSYKKILSKHKKIMTKDSRLFLNRRLLNLSFSIGDTDEFDLAYQELSSMKRISFKNRVMKFSWMIPSLRVFLIKKIN